MSSDHWPQFYNHRQSPPPAIFSAAGDGVSTVTTTTAGNSFSPPTNPPPSTAAQFPGPEGRVAKPVRRRSRASRRTPTTLLNTDTTNFRAMVQQFTGGPSAPYGTASSHLNTQSFGFSMNTTNPRPVHVNPGPGMVNPNSGFQIQYPNPPQSQLPYMFSLGNNSESQDGFFNRIGSNTANNSIIPGTAEDGGPASGAAAAPGENRGNSFLF